MTIGRLADRLACSALLESPRFPVGDDGSPQGGMQGSLIAAVHDLARAQHGALTTHQLRRLGVSAKAERTARRDGWLTLVDEGVAVVAASPDTWARRLQIGLLALDGRGWISHDAAAAWYGWRPGEPVEFTVPRAARSLGCGAVVHTTDVVADGDVRRVRGLRCSSPIRTIVDLAAAGAPDLDRLLDVATRRGLTDHPAVAARLAAWRGRPGARALDRALRAAA